MSSDFDFCIIGGGVVGLAIARQLSSLGSVLLTEQHDLLGSETSSRNSEVIHAGLYYAPGSLKESLCLRGKHLLYDFCQRYQIPHRPIGKLIVAQQPNDPALDRLQHKAQQLGIPLQRWNQQQLQQQEPAVRASEALYSPTTGIIDSHSYIQALTHQAEQQGALVMRQTRFLAAQQTNHGPAWQIALHTSDGPFTTSARWLINCAGLQAQQVAADSGLAADQIPNLYPCRGHYFSYSGRSPFRHLIYPLPEKNLTGLGIHATLDLGGQVKFGPDTEYLASDDRSYQVRPQLRDKFASAIRRYFPALDEQQLQPDYAGIRPKLHNASQSATDFCLRLDQAQKSLHLFGIESPGLTASLALAEWAERSVSRE